jgi:hypothetical protein
MRKELPIFFEMEVGNIKLEFLPSSAKRTFITDNGIDDLNPYAL